MADVTYYKGYIGEEDLNIGLSTFVRRDKDGAYRQLTQINKDTFKIDWYFDVRDYADFPTAITELNAYGTNVCLLISEECVVDADINCNPEVYLMFIKEGILNISSGYNVDVSSPHNILTSFIQHIFSGSGTVTFSYKNGWVSPFWWGAVNDPSNDSTDSGAEFNLALATGCNMFIPAGTYSTTVGIVQNTSDQTVEAYGVTLRVNADVIGWQLGVTDGSTNVNRCNLLGDIYIRNYSDSSTKAGIRVESVRYSKIEAYVSYGFNYGIELLASGALGCVYNDIFVKYLYTDDATDGYPIFVNHVSDVAGYVFNNRIHLPTIWGTYKYGIYFKKRASGATNTLPFSNDIYHPVISGTGDRGVEINGRNNIYGGHYENTQNVYNCSIDTATYTWNASGSGTNEYYITPALPPGTYFGSTHSVKDGSTALTWGALGSLVADGFGWGDNDAIGYNTLYVRCTDGVAPGDGDITYIDLNEIHLASDADNCFIQSNDLNSGVTNEGQYNQIMMRQHWSFDFQDANNAQIGQFKRNSIQSYSGSNPLLELNDSYTAAGFSYPLKLKVGRAVVGSYFIRGMNSAGTELWNVDGTGKPSFTLPTYADNATAVAAGLAVKDLYKTATGEVRVVV